MIVVILLFVRFDVFVFPLLAGKLEQMLYINRLSCLLVLLKLEIQYYLKRMLMRMNYERN